MTAVFVHGVPETPAVWHGLLAALGRPDTVTLSLPGFGTAPPGRFRSDDGRVRRLAGGGVGAPG
jgi:hypothetical protein